MSKNKPHTVRDYGHETARIWDAIDDLRWKRRGRSTTQYVIGGAGGAGAFELGAQLTHERYATIPTEFLDLGGYMDGATLDQKDRIWLVQGVAEVDMYRTIFYEELNEGEIVWRMEYQMGYEGAPYWAHYPTTAPGEPRGFCCTRSGHLYLFSVWVAVISETEFRTVYNIFDLGHSDDPTELNLVATTNKPSEDDYPTYWGLAVDDENGPWVIEYPDSGIHNALRPEGGDLGPAVGTRIPLSYPTGNYTDLGTTHTGWISVKSVTYYGQQLFAFTPDAKEACFWLPDSLSLWNSRYSVSPQDKITKCIEFREGWSDAAGGDGLFSLWKVNSNYLPK